jgi:hypothetical protein
VGVETAFWCNDSVLTPLRPRYERRNPDEIAADPRCPTAEVLHGTLCRLARIAPITATLANGASPQPDEPWVVGQVGDGGSGRIETVTHCVPLLTACGGG